MPNLVARASGHPEDLPKAGVTPFEYVLQTASAKCLAAYEAAVLDPAEPDPELVIAADTVVVGWGGEVLEKPRSEREHIAMLTGLRDAGRPVATSDGVDGGIGGAVGVALGPGFRGEGRAVAGGLSGGSSAVPLTAGGVGGESARKGAGWHRVFTAVAALAPLASAKAPGYTMETVVEETGVKFAEDSEFPAPPSLADTHKEYTRNPTLTILVNSLGRLHPCLRTHARGRRQGGRLRYTGRRRAAG